MLKTYAVNDLLPGMMVTKVIEQSGVVKIRKVGMIRSPDMIKGLSEMGVSMVEVDLAQSLGIEPEINANSEAVVNEVISATPTQRLVASNKRIADADRQLSQQFHRSLFLPAVDQMPSKWTLYGKPYGLLVLTIAAGLVIGFGAISIPSYLSTDKSILVNEKQTQELQLEQQNIAPSNTTEQTPALNAKSEEIISTAVPNNNIAQVLTPEPVSEDKPEQALAQTTVKAEPQVEQLVTMNGVIVQSGQQVLGYQTPEREDYNNASNTNDGFTRNNRDNSPSSNVSSPVASFELLRRAKEAANEIDMRPDSQSAEPFKVTDLNDLKRIDQLSPAIQIQLPAMSFSAHMYASNETDRWVRVNGKRIREGDFIATDLQLMKIDPETVVLSFRGQEFTMNALTDW